jgi:outer membrane receptor protein involved in Fe transport
MELRRDVVVGTRTGERDVLAVFSELAVPLLASDSPLGRADLSVAGRYEDYEDFGTTFDPKVGLSWSPWEQLKLRGTWGTSFRAPPFHQNATTFGESVGLAVRIPDPRSPVRTSQVIVVGGNNPDLKEETADVWTAGLDWAVPIDGDLSVSLTYFSIDYQDKIGVPDALFGLLNNEATWAPVINRDPSQAEIDAACSTPGFRTPCVGPFAAIIDYRTRNLASVEVRGVDSELQYTLPSSFGSWRLGIRGTYNDKYDTAVTATSPVSERVNTVGSPLKLRLVGTIGWNWQQWTAATAVRYQNSYDDVTATLSRPVSSWTTLDLTVVYNVDLRGSWLDETRLSLAAINALDKEPPFVDRDFGYDGVNSTILGRQLAFQVTKSW